tara:strand:+ start:261 stop:506 length:246 start_codon:yes stop_codon:yes gene_type:complete
VLEEQKETEATAALHSVQQAAGSLKQSLSVAQDSWSNQSEVIASQEEERAALQALTLTLTLTFALTVVGAIGGGRRDRGGK